MPGAPDALAGRVLGFLAIQFVGRICRSETFRQSDHHRVAFDRNRIQRERIDLRGKTETGREPNDRTHGDEIVVSSQLSVVSCQLKLEWSCRSINFLDRRAEWNSPIRETTDHCQLPTENQLPTDYWLLTTSL
jgi:hypothetical protein